MLSVLVTGAGGAGGVGAIRTLKETTSYEVVGVDMNADAAGLYLADSARQVAPATDEDWSRSITAVLEEFDVDVVIPTVDEELPLLPELPDDVPIVAPRQEVIETALDKYATYRHLDEAGHSVPQTWAATAVSSVPTSAYPILIKPRTGRGSRGVRRVDSPGDVETAIAEANYEPEELLLQEFIEGTEYTTSVVVTKDDRILGIVPKEAMEKDGSTVKGVTRRNEAVTNECRRIAETLSPRGPINVQQIVDKEGTPYTIEINPRFSSTSCLTAAAGVNEFDLLIRDALGEDVSPPADYKDGLYILRYGGHVFVDQDKLATRPPSTRDN